MSFTVSLLAEDIADGMSPSSMAINLQAGSSSRIWRAISNKQNDGTQTFDVQPADVLTLIHDVLGTTAYPVNQGAPGRLNRTLPLIDPLIPWLYASDIQAMRGFGTYQLTSPQTTTQTNNFPGFALWSNYDFTVASSTRPYPVISDDQIVKATSTWQDISGTNQKTDYYPEWNRFCDFTFTPKAEWLEQQRGSSYFVTGTNNEPGANAQQTSQQSVRMLMPDSIFKIMWVGVPLRYVLSKNSYLTRFRGRINQNSWEGPGGVGTTFAPGSLLYWDFVPRIYMPPVPISINWAGSFLDYTRLCDVELIFMHTSRTVTDAPASGTNKNYIVGGFNLLPYLPRRQFYYAENRDLGGNKYPQFWSIPVEILFSDPDAPGAYTGNG
jgi:hypothetical protein